MFGWIRHLCSSWAWRMAWRDSRSARWKMVLFSASIVFGVAALVTIGSLRENMTQAVKGEAKSLLGADLLVSSREKPNDASRSLLDDIGGEDSQRARELSFTTMLSAGEGKTPSLVTLRGLEPKFPFYGQLVTEPTDAWQKVQNEPGVILEASFMKRMGINLGDAVKFGSMEFPVAGVLKQAPPSGSGFAAFSPTVVMPLRFIENSELTGSKSLVFYRTYYKLPTSVDAESLVKKYNDDFQKLRLTQVTAKKRSENVEKAINRLYIFFNLIGFSALFLGGIGVAGAIHIHISERLRSVATLRCLGCSSSRAFSVYLAQSIAMGVLGTLAGILVGGVILLILKAVVANLPEGVLPFAIELAPSWPVVLRAAGVGVFICVSFALLPLLAVRRVSPLAALRGDAVSAGKPLRDPLRWLVIFGLMLMAFLLTWWDMGAGKDSWKTALGYIVFLLLAAIVLMLSGYLLRWLARILARPSWPFVIRQAVANLHRPNNQTGLFMVSIGLGTFIIFTLLLLQNILLQWLDPVRMSERPNIFLVDVPPEENAAVQKIITDSGVTVLGNAPIVQMRLTKIKGVPVQKLADDSVVGGKKIPKWILRREFRSTFREQLTDTEKLIAGKWIGEYRPGEHGKSVPVSFERKLAGDLGIEIGDEVTVSIEGFDETVPLIVASLREVEWQSMNLNFFIVFPKGAIDEYVSFNVAAANSPDDASTAKLQRAIFERLPFVNSIDLSLILRTVQSVLQAAGKAVQIMALFTIFTGAIVLVACILAGRRIRIRESILLRTLGATRAQISKILAVEYTLLGSMATLSGATLAVVASMLLGNKVFDGEPYVIPWLLLAEGVGAVVLITVILGMLLSRGVASQPPLQILRSERNS